MCWAAFFFDGFLAVVVFFADPFGVWARSAWSRDGAPPASSTTTANAAVRMNHFARWIMGTLQRQDRPRVGPGRTVAGLPADESVRTEPAPPRGNRRRTSHATI